MFPADFIELLDRLREHSGEGLRDFFGPDRRGRFRPS